MRLGIFALAALALLPGCMSERLRQRTVSQGSTLPELQYQQVLDNLALFSVNPSALPWHLNIREGTTQITDSASFGAVVDLGPPTSTFPQLFGSRTAVAQWGGTPVIDPLELRLLRIAYRRAHGSQEMPNPEVIDELAHELKSQVGVNSDLSDESELFYEYQAKLRHDYAGLDSEIVTTNDESFTVATGLKSPLARNVTRQITQIEHELARIDTGWFCVGRKRDVPRNACYVGRYRDCWVWVLPEGRESLTEFTLATMKLSSLIKETQTLLSPGSVKFSPGDHG